MKEDKLQQVTSVGLYPTPFYESADSRDEIRGLLARVKLPSHQFPVSGH